MVSFYDDKNVSAAAVDHIAEFIKLGSVQCHYDFKITCGNALFTFDGERPIHLIVIRKEGPKYSSVMYISTPYKFICVFQVQMYTVWSLSVQVNVFAASSVASKMYHMALDIRAKTLRHLPLLPC